MKMHIQYLWKWTTLCFVFGLVLFAGCQDEFDDSKLQQQIDGLDDRVSKLETLCNQMNTNLQSLQTIVNALQQGDYVTEVTPILEGEMTIGYTIRFAKNKPITIYHGEDGEKGEKGDKGDKGDKGEQGEQGEKGEKGEKGDKGDKGEQGEKGEKGDKGEQGERGTDGYVPIIGIKQDSDGKYYWTLDGEWLLDEQGNRVKAVGEDGEKGDQGTPGQQGEPGIAGTPGKNGITPQLKIEEDYWYISYNNGESWQEIGKATGKDGDSFFKEVDNSSEKYVDFIFADGSSIRLPKLLPLEIQFNVQDLITIPAKGSRDVHYTINHADTRTKVEAVSSGDLKVKVISDSPEAGTIHIQALDTVDEYSHVVVFASDSVSRVTMEKLTFEEGIIRDGDGATNKTIEANGGNFWLYFLTNIDYEVIIDENASSWISPQVSSRAVTEHFCWLTAQANTGESRTGTVTIQDKNSNMYMTYTITQKAYVDVELALKTEREALMDLYNSTNGAGWVNNTNWGSDKPVSEWFGIQCNADGTIWSIDLRQNNLQGQIPSSIGNFVNLTSLTLESNELYGEIPSEIGKLKNLSGLSLQYNQLSGTLPKSLVECRDLSSLQISANNLTDLENCMDIITQFPKMNYLNMGGLSKFCGPLPSRMAELMSFPDLSYFDISYCGFNGDIPQEILQHPRWDDFAFYIVPQKTNNGQPDGYSIGGFNLDGVTYKVADFSVEGVDGKIFDSSILKENKLTLFFPITSGEESGLAKTKILYEDYKDKGLGIVSFFRLWAPWDPEELAKEEQWVQDMIQKYGMEWYSFIEGSSSNEISNVPKVWTVTMMGADSYPTNSFIVDSEGNVIYNAAISGTDGVRDFIEKIIGKVLTYESTDYSRDGEVQTLQTASQGAGIDLVLLGDGFTDEDIADGTYDRVMEQAAENFFTTEPIASYRSCFNVRSVKAVSKNGYFASGYETALSCAFGSGTEITGNHEKCIEYAQHIPNYDPSRTVILVILNDKRYAGTCYMYSDGLAIAYCPMTDGYESERFVQIINHEGVGHGFAKLGDEYSYEQNGAFPPDLVAEYRQQQEAGWWGNVDFTSDPNTVRWHTFLTDSRYQTEGLGVYEGALTYMEDVYKSTTASIMNTNVGIFNAPSREAIYKRIMQLVYGTGWQYDYEDFVEQDLKNIPSAAKMRQSARQVPAQDFVPLHPPVIVR